MPSRSGRIWEKKTSLLCVCLDRCSERTSLLLSIMDAFALSQPNLAKKTTPPNRCWHCERSVAIYITCSLPWKSSTANCLIIERNGLTKRAYHKGWLGPNDKEIPLFGCHRLSYTDWEARKSLHCQDCVSKHATTQSRIFVHIFLVNQHAWSLAATRLLIDNKSRGQGGNGPVFLGGNLMQTEVVVISYIRSCGKMAKTDHQRGRYIDVCFLNNQAKWFSQGACISPSSINAVRHDKYSQNIHHILRAYHKVAWVLEQGHTVPVSDVFLGWSKYHYR